MRTTVYPNPIVTVAMLCLLVASCNSKPADVPLPPDAGYKQPQSQPLVFTAPKRITWDTTKRGGLHPTIKHFDINALPAESYDSLDFMPFSQPPVQTTFNFNKLRSVPFNIDSLPAKPLKFKEIYLGNIPRVKASMPLPKAGTALSVSSLGPSQGIPGSFVTAILKEKSGAIWIATNEALCRYSGDEVQVYVPQLHALINNLMQDGAGNIWFMNGNGLNMINPASGIVYHSVEVKGKTDYIAYTQQDEEGNIWIANAATNSLLRINPLNKTFTPIDRAIGINYSYGVAENAAKNICVSTFKGLHIFDLHAKTLKYLTAADGLGGDSLAPMATDSSGHIWVGVHSPVTGNAMKEINFNTGTITSYVHPGMQQVILYNVMVSGSNRVWLGGGFGAMVIDIKQKAVRLITKAGGLPGKNVIALAQDNSKRVWLGTSRGFATIISNDADLVNPIDNASISTMLEAPGGDIWIGRADGVKIIDPQKKRVRYFNEVNGLSDNQVQTFTVMDSSMWITSNGGFDIINSSKKTIEHIGKAEGLANDTVYSILKTSTGEIWFTAPSVGVDVIDNKKATIRHIDTNGGLSDNAVTDVREDRHGLIWLATLENGVDVIDVTNGTVKYLNNVPGLKANYNKLLMRDSNGRMWIGTDKGLYIADTKVNTLTNITTANGLPDDRIKSLLEREGKVYVATNTNVTVIAPPGKTQNKWIIEQLAGTESLTKESLNTWATHAITAKGQYLWGDSGVTIINGLAGYNYTNPTYITGLQVNNEQGNFLTLPKGNLPDTLLWQDSFKLKQQIPVLAGYSKKNGMDWDSTTGPYNMPANLHVGYSKNYMQFQYLQVRTGGRVAPVYRYILLGIDKQWSKETKDTYTQNYLNLPPGAYIFKVTSKGPDGKWSTPAGFSFTITPPKWKTWWAYTIYVLLILFAIGAFIRYRSRKLVAENVLLEEKIKQRTEALQKSLEDLKVTQGQLIQSEKMASLGELTAGIAHEIQNPLNFVNNFSEVSRELIKEMQDELKAGNTNDAIAIAADIDQNLEKINHHGKRADNIVKGMLQHSRRSTGLKELTNINALADEYLRLAYHGLRAKDKSFNATMHTSFDESIGKINIMPQDVGRVLLNMFNNAFYAVREKAKTAPAGYKPTIEVLTALNHDKVLVTVKDNGTGIPAEIRDKIMQPFFTTKPTGQGTGLGLSLSYDIIKAHNGEIKIDSEEGQGTAFTIILPLNKAQ